MNIVRTIVWVLLLAVLLIFSIANWDQDVEVQIWDNLVWDTKLPAVVVVSFLIGLVPMWLLHRATVWRLQRKIGSLEASLRNAVMAPPATPSATAQPAPGAAPQRPADDRLAPQPDQRAGQRPDTHPHAQPGPRSDTLGPSSSATHPGTHPDTREPRPGSTARVDGFGPRDR